MSTVRCVRVYCHDWVYGLRLAKDQYSFGSQVLYVCGLCVVLFQQVVRTFIYAVIDAFEQLKHAPAQTGSAKCAAPLAAPHPQTL